MRIAVLADLHGDLGALEAILDDAARRGAEAVFLLGDALGGPDDAALVARLGGAGVVAVRGEADEPSADAPAEVRAYAEKLPAWIQVQDGDTRLAFCHADPRSPAWQPMDGATPEEQLQAAFEVVEADVLLVGHTHKPLARRIGDRALLNPGRAGGGDAARYLLVNTEGGLTAAHVRVGVGRDARRA